MNEVQFYRDKAGDWRWRYVHTNGNVMADSGQGYSRRIDAMTAAQTVFGGAIQFTLGEEPTLAFGARPQYRHGLDVENEVEHEGRAYAATVDLDGTVTEHGPTHSPMHLGETPESIRSAE